MTALNSSIAAVRIAAAAADRIKASNIVAFDVSKPMAITDIMMIATGANGRNVLAIAQEIEKDLYTKADKLTARSREGLSEGEWVLLDYGDFVIHVLNEDAREFYGLERLWQDCPPIDLQLPQHDPQEAESEVEPSEPEDGRA